jgi:hypothetical protein
VSPDAAGIADGGTGPPATPTGQEPAAVGGDAFWALEGLRGRVPPDPGAVLFTGVVTAPGADRPYLWQETFAADDLFTSGWAEAGTALGALASPVRMQLLREILHGRNTAAALAEVEGFGTSGQIYHHLRQLTAAGWLRTSSRDRFDVPPERIVPLLVAAAEGLSEALGGRLGSLGRARARREVSQRP